MRITALKFGPLAGGLMSLIGTAALAQERRKLRPAPAQVVALDECDHPLLTRRLARTSVKNVALGAATTFNDLFAKAQAGTPDPGWDFEPDVLHIRKELHLL